MTNDTTGGPFIHHDDISLLLEEVKITDETFEKFAGDDKIVTRNGVFKLSASEDKEVYLIAYVDISALQTAFFCFRAKELQYRGKNPYRDLDPKKTIAPVQGKNPYTSVGIIF